MRLFLGARAIDVPTRLLIVRHVALRGSGRPFADGDDALAELAIEAAIHRSSETDVPVRVPSL